MSIHSYTSLGGASFIGELWAFGAARGGGEVSVQGISGGLDTRETAAPAQAGAALFVPSQQQQQAAWRSAWGRPGMHGVARQNDVFFSSSVI